MVESYALRRIKITNSISSLDCRDVKPQLQLLYSKPCVFQTHSFSFPLLLSNEDFAVHHSVGVRAYLSSWKLVFVLVKYFCCCYSACCLLPCPFAPVLHIFVLFQLLFLWLFFSFSFCLCIQCKQLHSIPSDLFQHLLGNKIRNTEEIAQHMPHWHAWLCSGPSSQKK